MWTFLCSWGVLYKISYVVACAERISRAVPEYNADLIVLRSGIEQVRQAIYMAEVIAFFDAGRFSWTRKTLSERSVTMSLMVSPPMRSPRLELASMLSLDWRLVSLLPQQSGVRVSR